MRILKNRNGTYTIYGMKKEQLIILFDALIAIYHEMKKCTDEETPLIKEVKLHINTIQEILLGKFNYQCKEEQK